MAEAELRRRAGVTALIAASGVPLALLLIVLGAGHRATLPFLFAPVPVLGILVVIPRNGGRRVRSMFRPASDVRVAPTRYREALVTTLLWASLGQWALSSWELRAHSAPSAASSGLDRALDVVFGSLNVAALAPLALFASAMVVSFARGRPCLRLYPDRLEMAGLFVTQVVPWSAIGPLNAWTPAAPWVRRRHYVDILAFPLAWPELVTYRSRVPLASWAARRLNKDPWLELPYHRLAVAAEGIAEAVREYTEGASRVPNTG
jgi:hypothetical protein